MNKSKYSGPDYEQAIAVVGMAGTFSNASTLDDLWANLLNGYEAVRFLDAQTLRANGCPAAMLAHPMFVPATAMMTGVDRFDAEFFGFTPAEARLMDPQLRLMLQTAWHAFESANIVPDRARGLTGVFAGGHRSDYLLCTLGPEYSIQTGMQALTASLFNGQDYLSTWISYKLGLTGPSITVQSACSTGLVLVATACQNLLDYSCDTALAIAGAVFSPRDWGYLAETGSILSADGHCRPYDAAAGGTITGEGVGAVILKRLHDALEDDDPIFGIIRGYAINNDGALRAGYAAPSVAGQRALLVQALASAGLQSGDVTYIEGHGTGTQLGDPIEFKALQSVFGQSPRKKPCLLGSIKANLGHLGACAGMVGLQKTLLMLGRGVVPPQINYTEPNPELGMRGSAFRICTEACAWPEDRPKIAGVSSFGLGGTNCHMIVEGFEDAPGPPQQPDPLGGTLPLCLSARSEKALHELCENWVAFLQQEHAAPLGHAAASLLAGRAHMPWRVAVAAGTAADAAGRLQARAKGVRIAAQAQDGKIVLLLHDPGKDDFALCRKLFQDAEDFRNAFAACADRCEATQGPDLTGMLLGARDIPPGSRDERLLGFAAACALAHLLVASGVRLHMVAGRGVGALAASALCGAMPLEECLGLLGGCIPPPAQFIESPPAGFQLPDVELVAEPQGGVADQQLIDQCLRGGARFFLVLGSPRAQPPARTPGGGEYAWIPLFPASTPDAAAEREAGPATNPVAQALAALFLAGAPLTPGRRQRLGQIPLYPFEENRHWPERSRNFCDMLRAPGEAGGGAAAPGAGPSLPGEPEHEATGHDGFSLEQRMGEIWNAALGIDDMAPDDDFFARGGTSLSAIAIVAGMEKLTGLTIELRELMQLRTINAVLARLAQLANEENAERMDACTCRNEVE